MFGSVVNHVTANQIPRWMVSEPIQTPVAPAEKKSRPAPEKPNANPERQPPYNVILWNDDEHTVDYVVHMLKQLFGHPEERGRQLAKEVDRQGRAIVWTTAREHAELKRDQIHAFGDDPHSAKRIGPMSATIEPAGV